MEIHRRKHHVAREQERFEGDDAARINAEHRSSAAVEHAQRADELVAIVASVDDAREIRIAQKIIHAVGVEIGSAHQFSQYRIRRHRIAEDQFDNAREVDTRSLDCRSDLRKREDFLGTLLVLHAEHGLAGVAERSVADIVEQQTHAQQAALRNIIRFTRKIPVVAASESIEHPLAHRESAERVTEARMFCRRKGEIGETELAQAPQTLHRRRIEQRDFVGSEFDEMVDRIENAFHRAGGTRSNFAISLERWSRGRLVPGAPKISRPAPSMPLARNAAASELSGSARKTRCFRLGAR